MAFPPELIKRGKCYLVSTERGDRVRRVVGFRDSGFVGFEERLTPGASSTWRGGAMRLDAFARIVRRQVPCDWLPVEDQEQGIS